MADPNAEFTVVAGTGSVYFAPVGTTLPTEVDTALDAAFENLGYTTEDGVGFDESIATSALKVWQSSAPLRYTVDDVENSLQFSLVQWDKDTVPFAFGGGVVATTSAGKYKYTPPSTYTGVWAIVLDIVDGTVTHRIVAPKARVGGTKSVSFTSSDWAGIAVALQLERTSPSVAPFEYFTDSPGFA